MLLYDQLLLKHHHLLLLLEKHGHNVIVRGKYGIVNKQYPKANTEIKHDLETNLEATP